MCALLRSFFSLGLRFIVALANYVRQLCCVMIICGWFIPALCWITFSRPCPVCPDDGTIGCDWHALLQMLALSNQSLIFGKFWALHLDAWSFMEFGEKSCILSAGLVPKDWHLTPLSYMLLFHKNVYIWEINLQNYNCMQNSASCYNFKWVFIVWCVGMSPAMGKQSRFCKMIKFFFVYETIHLPVSAFTVVVLLAPKL